MSKKRTDETRPALGDAPSPRPGTRMLAMPPPPASPFKLTEEQVEQLRREEARRASKKAAKKRVRRHGAK